MTQFNTWKDCSIKLNTTAFEWKWEDLCLYQVDIIISEVHSLVRGPLWHNYLACFHLFKPYVWPNRTTKTCLILPKWADNHFKRDCVTFERRFKTFFHLKMKAWIQKKYNAPLLDSTHDRVFSGMTSSWLWLMLDCQLADFVTCFYLFSCYTMCWHLSLSHKYLLWPQWHSLDYCILESLDALS